MYAYYRVYVDVNVHRPQEYWDYENLAIDWGYARTTNTYYIYIYACIYAYFVYILLCYYS